MVVINTDKKITLQTMTQEQLSNLFLEQSKDLIWMINPDFNLVYANRAYQNLMKEVTGKKKKLNESVFTEDFGVSYVSQYKAYYTRALKGEYFEIEEHFSNPKSNEIQYLQITFKPIKGDNQKIVGVACQSRDISRIVKRRSEANQLMDASLDVFCTINEVGNFTYVSAAAETQWGYKPDELLGTNYRSLVIEEDLAATDSVVTTIKNGQEIKSFSNRYRKKDGGIAYNIWSSRWDERTKLFYSVARDGKEKLEQEEIISQSELRFKALVQEGSDLIAILDEEANYTYVSPTSNSILGIPPEEFIGKSPFEFIHPDDVEKTKACLQKITTENKVTVAPFRFQNHKKEWRWIETVLSNMLDNPAVNGIVANSRDITDEKNLKELNWLAGKLAKIGSWEINLKTKTIYWSNEVHQLHETDPNSYKPTIEDTKKFFREDFREFVQSKIENCIATGESFDFEAVIITANKKEIWVRVIGEAEIVNGECIRIYGSFQDIHDRKANEIALQQSEAKFRTIFEIATLGIAQVDPTNGRVILVNSYYESITGYSADELLKMNFLELTHPDDREKDWELFSKAARGEEEYKNEKRYIKKDGTIVWVRIHLAFIRDDKGKPIRTVAICENITERKTAALQLEKSLKALKDYKSALDQSAIVATTDKKGVITSVNSNFCEISKFEKEELIGNTHRLVNSNHHPKEFFKVLWKTIKSGNIWRAEVKNKAKDGTYYWVDTTIVPFLDQENKPFQYLAIRFDITERKKAEQEKINLQETLENSLNEIYMFDSETLKFNYVNKGALLNLGYTQPEMKELTPLDLKPDYTAASFKKLIAPLINNEKGKIVFFTNHKRKDGSLYPVEVHLQLVTSAPNDRFLAIILDITERKKAEEVILKANERFEKVTEATNDAIWDWDIINETFYRSNAIEDFFGKQTSKTLSHKDFWKDAFHPDDLLHIKESLNIVLSDSSCNRWEAEYRVFDYTGKVHYVLDRGIIIRNEEGKAIRMIGAMTNISDQKDYEIQLKALNQELEKHAIELERSNQELEQFAFVTSHDLQEPLRMISGFMDQLKRKYEDQLDEKALQYIYFATDGAKRMKQIILDLLDYSRASKPSQELEKVNLNEVIASFKQLRRKVIAESSATIISSELPSIKSYSAVVTQIFHGLLDNAIKYARDGVAPIVEIEAKEKEKEWEFSITDNGIGIDSQFFQKIFIIFQRLHNRNKYDGTGIGLAIVKRSVEFLNGKIWLSSTVGKGTTFNFTITKNIKTIEK